MVKKVLPNRISKAVSPDAAARLQQAVQIILDLLGEETQISLDDYNALYKIADKRKLECDEVYGLMKANPSLVKQPLSVAETQKDKAFYEFCDEIQAALKSIKTRTDREQNIAGGEYVNACSLFETDVNAEAHRGIGAAQMVQAELKKISRNRAGNSKKKTTVKATV
jgi:hypothetical protein